MTEDQINKFLTLLMGQCWHEWEWKPKDGDIHIYECKCGLRVGSRPQNPNHLSNPLLVIRWMEKEMPEVLNGYVDGIFVTYRDERWGSECLMEALNLEHLVVYLKLHPEWGEKECPTACNDMLEFKCCQKDNYCHGTGRITRPAWEYLKEVKG
jgi:hypothetical protein